MVRLALVAALLAVSAPALAYERARPMGMYAANNGPALAQVGIPGFGADGVRIAMDLERDIRPDLFRRLFTATNLIRQPRQGGETFRRDVVLVGQKINERGLDD